MSKEKKKTSINISKLVKQVKKEHFTKLILQISTILLLLFWIAMVLATSINTFSYQYEYGSPITIIDLSELEHYQIGSEIGDYVFRIRKATDLMDLGFWVEKINNKTPDNPMLLLDSPDTLGWWFAILLSPIGFLSLLTYISIQKNMITPQAIKKTVRKALQFNYLKQKDVEYISDEIDYNIGIKERVDQDEKTLE